MKCATVNRDKVRRGYDFPPRALKSLICTDLVSLTLVEMEGSVSGEENVPLESFQIFKEVTSNPLDDRMNNQGIHLIYEYQKP